ncbi:MAG TPA: G5 domain-containing protein [Candidatus Anaerotignum merdipullorum]|nr:G5 domain-containing protein [Candidatus Anaerotignum merdipullorum]
MEKKSEQFPKREERVLYSGKSGGVPEKPERVRSSRKSARRVGNKNRKTAKKWKWTPKRAGIGAGVVLLVLLFFVFFYKNGTEVFVGENSMGILSDTSVTAETLVTNLEAQLAASVGTNVQINEEIRTEKLHVGGDRKKDVCTMEYLMPKLRNAVTYKVEASVIFVDGGAVAPLATQEEANQVLTDLKAPYLPQDETSNAEVSFVETVTIENQFVDSAEILSAEDAMTVLTSTTPVTTTHTVQTGDTLARIAAEYDMTLEELYAANPGTSATIVVGQTLNVTQQKPMVSVKSVETQVLTTVEKKQYETQYDDTQPASYQRVIQQGRDGQKKSTIQITRINGFVTEEKEISKEIIQEPVTEIILRGTQ